jgi:hypothetical protein
MKEKDIRDADLVRALKELYYWQKSRGDNFHSILYTMFQKADRYNYKKLARGFPEEELAYSMWCKAGDYGDELFRDLGLME